MKALLVLHMPKSCEDCILCDYSWWCVADKEERKGNDKQRPEWCPLKPIPQKKRENDIIYEPFKTDDYNIGYNDCIDEILGGK